ncbi:MAG TPA: GNAT family N-acetyltransferase [Candidatus Binataceae bacterium]|nr:GNAT family N-acetyltransferase [Candidatus Binataceae bacterium]
MTNSTPDAAAYSAEEILRDGGSIHIRAIRADDRDRLLRHFNSLSEQSIYFRFFGVKRGLSERELVRMTAVDFVEHVCLVATLRDGDDERFIGVVRYVRSPNAAGRAEVAFAVLDDHQGRGIATVLLEHLSRVARAAGITEFEANVLGDNNRMLEVFGRSGFRVRRSAQGGVIHLSFPTAETAEFIHASHVREHAALVRSVESILRPRAVAVIGASRDTGKIGGAVLANLLRGGFSGAIYPVNHAAAEVQGLRSYPAISAIGAPVDLAVVAVPAAAVAHELGECARAGVHAAVVLTAGFAEAGESGRAAERQLFELVRGSGMRMVGPNCMGVINMDPAVRLNATFAPVEPPSGNIGMFSQSGALGIAILEHLRRRNLGLSTFVSGGNRADVSNNDLMAYWADDPNTAVIMLYLESVGNPRKFAQIARETARIKPIVAVKSGRSAAGTRAASSHSAALANLDVAVEALFEQAGVIRTSTLEELFDVAALLSNQPVPRGPRVGVVSNAGGPAVLLADACEAHGLDLPGLDEKTFAQLRSFLPPLAAYSNPVDITSAAGAEDFERALKVVGNDPGVDALVSIYVPPIMTNSAAAAAGIARGAGSVPRHKPVLSVFLSTQGPPAELNGGPRGKIPVYDFPENAAIALSAAWRHGCWLKRPSGNKFELTQFARDAIRAVVDRVLAGARDEACWVAPEDLNMILRAAGIEFVHAEQTTVELAPEVANRLGYPLVAKAIAPSVVHKGEAGGIMLGLKTADEVASAAATLRERMSALGVRMEGVTLQRQINGGIETMVGVITDATFGPLIVCGSAGATVELFRDAAFRLHPVTDVDAAEMIDSLQLSRLLGGYRGAPAGDREALIGLLMRVSAMVEAVPELAELDLNPIKVMTPGSGALVLDGRLRLRPQGAKQSDSP